MRITRFFLPSQIAKNKGIDSIDMHRLGFLVSLIGKNGSGKSRILNLFEQEFLQNLVYENFSNDWISHVPKPIDNLIKQIDKLNQEIDHLSTEVKSIPQITNSIDALKLKPGQAVTAAIRIKNNNEIINLTNQLKDLNVKTNEILKKKKEISDIKVKIPMTLRKYYHRISYSEIRSLQLVLESVSEDKSQLSFEDLLDDALLTEEYNELDSMYKSGLTFLSKLPNEIIDDFINTLGDIEKFHQAKSWIRFKALSKYVEVFLGKKLDWDRRQIEKSVTVSSVTTKSQGLWKLDNREFNYLEFSEGEKILFSYSLLFFLLEQNSKLRIRESIIIIDEPELHLHPESEFKLVEKVSELVKEKGQLWIATHSISILSSLTYDQIFMVKNGTIIPPSRVTPGKSLIELMGLEEYVEKLGLFITDISNWAYMNYVIQCFDNPDVLLSAEKNDPEFELFKESIKAKTKALTLLDFGAGKGRIYKQIVSDETLQSTIKYSALEPDEENALELSKLGIDAYTDYSFLPEGSFDFILLCGVLHEIDVMQWGSVLNQLKRSLKDDGYMIIIEDKKLPKGEKIGGAGFLIMDNDSLKELFSLKSNPISIKLDDTPYENRILCATISKNSMQEVDDNSLLRSMKTLRHNVYEKIMKLREEKRGNNIANGREAAFLSQLYINSQVAIDLLSQRNN